MPAIRSTFIEGKIYEDFSTVDEVAFLYMRVILAHVARWHVRTRAVDTRHKQSFFFYSDIGQKPLLRHSISLLSYFHSGCCSTRIFWTRNESWHLCTVISLDANEGFKRKTLSPSRILSAWKMKNRKEKRLLLSLRSCCTSLGYRTFHIFSY